jgi:hypothetical protein
MFRSSSSRRKWFYPLLQLLFDTGAASESCAESDGVCGLAICWRMMDKQTYLSFDCSSGCKVMQQLPLSLKPAGTFFCVVVHLP